MMDNEQHSTQPPSTISETRRKALRLSLQVFTSGALGLVLRVPMNLVTASALGPAG